MDVARRSCSVKVDFLPMKGLKGMLCGNEKGVEELTRGVDMIIRYSTSVFTYDLDAFSRPVDGACYHHSRHDQVARSSDAADAKGHEVARIRRGRRCPLHVGSGE